MNAPADIRPIPYSPSHEVPEDKEAETIFDLKDTMRGISLKTWEDSGHALRSVHAKSHGLLVGELSVIEGLPESYAQGLFAQAGRYPAVLRHFANQGGEWELRIQLCTDLDKMPIEDASVEWPQALSPYVAVARLRIGPQRAWSEELSRLVDDGMQFNPWHALDAHRPLGAIMRVRKEVYAMSKRFRAERNTVEIVEPRELDALRAVSGASPGVASGGDQRQ
jgi:hypothetical protein